MKPAASGPSAASEPARANRRPARLPACSRPKAPTVLTSVAASRGGMPSRVPGGREHSVEDPERARAERAADRPVTRRRARARGRPRGPVAVGSEADALRVPPHQDREGVQGHEDRVPKTTYDHRQPSRLTRKWATGGSTNVPRLPPALASPTARPRRRVNHLTTVAWHGT